MLYHDWSCFSKHWSTVSAVLSRRRAATSVSSSRSCARPRRSQSSDPRGPTPSPAEAAPATTPASPTISTKACFWHTHLLTLPHTCEARNWNYCEKDSTDSLLSETVSTNVLQLGNTVGLLSFVCVLFLLPLLWLLQDYWGATMLNQNSHCWSKLWCVSMLSSFPSEKDLNYYYNHWCLTNLSDCYAL